MSGKLLQFWSVLQTREKITVLSGATLVLVTAVYLFFDGLWTSRSALMQDRTALIEEREWMQEQSAVAERLVSNCRDNQFLPCLILIYLSCWQVEINWYLRISGKGLLMVKSCTRWR